MIQVLPNRSKVGVCGEPKCATSAGQNSSMVTGFATLWRGKGENSRPNKTGQNGLSLNQMEFSETCGEAGNKKFIVMKQ